ncbi:hypothetical protein D6853_14255 [Butyrivibrio sp. X503]|uniref:hypothetical protein n=1 Tax=Butyrivibrio sp. X503 TaxID=2364878 RepID=UPI000EA9CC3B|nr:hypothetical protein [Butyrivibrio sp. X503]RKM54097.1 hypothetical protein D6853_14255 [Butyrivibrio sp. X503]
MRRKEFISKKLAVILMAATIVIAPIFGSMAAPIDAHAEMDSVIQAEDLGADPIPDNNAPLDEPVDEVPFGKIMDVNNGTVTKNEGIIEHNSDGAYVKDNNNAVRYNDGQIDENNYEVNNNTGHVDNTAKYTAIFKNDGEVGDNSGYVYNSTGNVDRNLPTGTVIGYPGTYCDKEANEGPYINTVNINYGNIINGAGENDVITINESYSGHIDTGYNTDFADEYGFLGGISVYRDLDQNRLGKVHIINNYGKDEYKDDDLVLVDNQYHGVQFDDIDNVTATYTWDDGDSFQFVAEKLEDGGTHHVGVWVQTGVNKVDIPITGIITIKANDGYKITDDGQTSGELEKISYSLGKNEDGSYTVNINSLKGSVLLTPEMLHLIVSELTGDEASEVKIGDTVVNLDEIKEDEVIVVKESSHSSSDNSNSGSAAEKAAPAGFNLTDAAIKSITEQVQKQVAANGNDIAALEVVDIYFGDKIDMTPDVIKYLCEKVPVAKRCHFDYKDQEYVMFIPAFDLVAPAYAEGLDTLDKEPAHTAGFLRITQIFEKLGFATKVVEEQEAAE